MEGEAPPVDRRRPVTRNDVARYAGVSTAVVSYVVNGGPRPVAEQTAAKVREAIDLLGYRPNLSARALKVGSTQTLGLILGDLENPFFAEIGLKLQAEAAAAGYAVLISSAHRYQHPSRVVVHDLVGRQVDGFLIDSGSATYDTLDYLRRHHLHVVVFDAPAPVRGCASVGSEASAGARLIVEHLVHTHAHRSVGLIIGDDGRASADARESGWQTALRSAGLLDGPIARAPFSRAGGYDGARRLLEAPNPPTAIFASSDLQGVGALRAVREAGLRVPEDIALVAFDGTVEAEYAYPPMTVARQPVDDMARSAVQQLLSSDHSHHTFPMELIIRQSCGCSPVN